MFFLEFSHFLRQEKTTKIVNYLAKHLNKFTIYTICLNYNN